MYKLGPTTSISKDLVLHTVARMLKITRVLIQLLKKLFLTSALASPKNLRNLTIEETLPYKCISFTEEPPKHTPSVDIGCISREANGILGLLFIPSL